MLMLNSICSRALVLLLKNILWKVIIVQLDLRAVGANSRDSLPRRLRADTDPRCPPAHTQSDPMKY